MIISKILKKFIRRKLALSTKSSFKHLKGRDKITKWNEFEYRNTTCVVWKITKFESTKFFKKFTFFPIFSFFLPRNPRPFSPRDTFDTQRRLGREFRMEIKVVGKLGGVASRSKKPGGTRNFFQLSGVKMIQCAAASFQSSQRAVYCLLPATCILLLRSLDKSNSLWYIVIGRGGDVWECRLGEINWGWNK